MRFLILSVLILGLALGMGTDFGTIHALLVLALGIALGLFGNHALARFDIAVDTAGMKPEDFCTFEEALKILSLCEVDKSQLTQAMFQGTLWHTKQRGRIILRRREIRQYGAYLAEERGCIDQYLDSLDEEVA